MRSSLDPLTGTLEISEPAGEETLRILFAGDFCPRLRPEAMLREGRGEEIYSEVLPALGDKDLSIVNLETPLTGGGSPIPKSGPNLRVDPACVTFLTAMGFDAVSLANNHIGDFGPDAVLETMETLDRHGLAHTGAGRDLEASRRPLFLEKKGFRIALVAVCEHEFGIATASSPGSAPLAVAENCRTIREAASRCDLTLVYAHSGNEFNPAPNPYMADAYHAFVEAGAAAVISAHAHCPQGIEVYRGAPIVYCLGNFLFDSLDAHADSQWWTGYLVRLVFTRRGAQSLEAIPYTFGSDGCRLSLLAGDVKTRFFGYLERLSNIAADPREREAYWEAWCALRGPWWVKYLEGARFPVDVSDGAAFKKLLTARNAFTCDAHQFLLRDFLRILSEGRFETALRGVEKIEALQKERFG